MRILPVFYLLFTLSFTFVAQAQLEGPNKKIKLGLKVPQEKTTKSLPSKKVTVPRSNQVIKYEPQFFKPKDAFNYVSTIPKIGEIQVKTYELRSNGEVYGKRIEDLNSDLEPKYISQNFGEYFSETRIIKILCRDYDAVDGDNVRILLNDAIAVRSCVLEEKYQTYFVDLTTTRNEIDFMALNEGAGSPNTAEFSILDENGKLIYSSKWELYEGYKARIIINRKF